MSEPLASDGVDPTLLARIDEYVEECIADLPPLDDATARRLSNKLWPEHVDQAIRQRARELADQAPPITEAQRRLASRILWPK